MMSPMVRSVRAARAAAAKIALAALLVATLNPAAALAAAPEDLAAPGDSAATSRAVSEASLAPEGPAAPESRALPPTDGSGSPKAAASTGIWNAAPGVEIGYSVDTAGAITLTSCSLGAGFSGSLEIPASIGGTPVVGIGPRAFSGCTDLVRLFIPDSVQAIAIQAFKGCSAMTEIRLPENGCQLGDLIFDGCTSLSSLTIPPKLTTYFSSPFYKSSLSDVTFAKGVTAIPDWLFRGCADLASIEIPDSVTSIGSSAFAECTSLTSISIPRSVKSVEYLTFSGCTALSHVALPDSITTIKASAFQNCTSLTAVHIPDSVWSLRDEAFLGCTALATIELPSRGCQLGERVFAGCTSLERLEIPAGLTASSSKTQGLLEAPSLSEVSFAPGISSLSERLFMNCPALETIDVPDSVASIRADAFRNCPSLKRVFVPSSVTRIAEGAFAHSENVTLEVWEDSFALSYADAQGIDRLVIMHDPKPAEGLVYTGSPLTGLDAHEGYALSGDVEAVHAGLYRAQATPNPGYCWPDRTTETKRITWSIARARIAAPHAAENLVYSGAAIRGVEGGEGYVLSGTTEATHAGDYRAQAVPDSDHCWQDGGEGSLSIDWSIARAPLTAIYDGETIAWNGQPTLAVKVEGFVGGEGPSTALGYRAPAIVAPETIEPGQSYTLAPQGGAACDYAFSYRAGTLAVEPAPAADFDDVAAGQWYADWVRKAVYAGLMKGKDAGDGTPSGLFDPEGNLKRSEAILILYRAATGASPHEPNGENSTPLVDLPEGELFYANAINWAWSEGHITGDMDNAGNLLYTYRPDDPISRQELAVMIHRVAGSKAAEDGGSAYWRCIDAGSEEPYATEALKWSASAGILTGAEIEGALYLNAGHPTTRAQAAKIFVVSQPHLQDRA